MNKINSSNKNSRPLNEGLERYDLADLVDGLFFVDRHVSKLGTDAEVATLTFRVGQKQAAQDLANYIEKAYDWILDADASPGPDQFQKYAVFVEISRTPKLVDNILKLLEELENITDSIVWQFKYKKDPKTLDLNDENLAIIPTTKDAYLQMIRSKAAESVKDFFADSNMHNINIGEDGTVTLTKKVNEWAPEQVIGFKLLGITDSKPGNLNPDRVSKTVNGLIGQNFVVENQADKFIIYNGKTTLEVKDLYAEKR